MEEAEKKFDASCRMSNDRAVMKVRAREAAEYAGMAKRALRRIRQGPGRAHEAVKSAPCALYNLADMAASS